MSLFDGRLLTRAEVEENRARLREDLMRPRFLVQKRYQWFPIDSDGRIDFDYQSAGFDSAAEARKDAVAFLEKYPDGVPKKDEEADKPPRVPTRK